MGSRSDEMSRREEHRNQVEVPRVRRPPVEEPEARRRPVTSSYSAQNKSEEQIRSDIEQTRAEMTETVDSIQEHINPQRLRREAQQAVQEATVGRARIMASRVRYRAQGVRQDFVQAVRENPIPAAMIALGLGWLLREVMAQETGHVRVPYVREAYGRPQPTPQEMQRRAEQTASQMAGQAQERASQAMEEARSRLDEAQARAMERADEAQARAEEIMGEAQKRFRRTSSQIGHFIEGNPLAAGAIALAAGALIGLAVPETQQENEWMGETRDTMMHRAQEAAQSTVRSTVGRAESAMRTAESMMGEAGKTERRPEEGSAPKS